MKLKFSKNSDLVEVCFVNLDGTTADFSYVEMVNRLYLDKIAEIPIIEGDFSANETESITSLLNDIDIKCKDVT